MFNGNPEQWNWAVTTTNGEYLTEEELGGWGAVDHELLDAVIVYKTDNPTLQYVMPVPQDATAFFSRRRKEIINPNTGETSNEHYATYFGWKREEAFGAMRFSYLFLMNDGSAIFSDCDIDELN